MPDDGEEAWINRCGRKRMPLCKWSGYRLRRPHRQHHRTRKRADFPGTWKNTFFTIRRTGPHKVELSLPRSLTARWTDLNDSCEKNTQQEGVSSPLEVRNRVSISSVTRMTSSSPVNRKNYWKEKSSPSSSSSCKNEVLNSLRRRQSSRTWNTALISSDKTCADIPPGNCSPSLPRRMLEPS